MKGSGPQSHLLGTNNKNLPTVGEFLAGNVQFECFILCRKQSGVSAISKPRSGIPS